MQFVRYTNDKFHIFYNEVGELLFDTRNGVNSDLSIEMQKEAAWAVAKVGLQVYNNENLATFMINRGEQVGWDSKTLIEGLQDQGRRNQNMLNFDFGISLGGGIFPDQNTREGKAGSILGAFFGRMDAGYSALTGGRDAQTDILNSGQAIRNFRGLDGMNVWERMLYEFKQGILWLNDPTSYK